MFWLLIASGTAWGLLALLDLVQLVTLPFVREARPCGKPLPRVSIVAAARDEADMAARCVSSLRALEYPEYEVIWVDDESTDGTPEIVERATAGDPRVTTLASAPRPEGWVGKTWALEQGTRLATSEWLLFVDADTVYHPECLSAAMGRALDESLDVFSLLPGYLSFGTAERFVAPAFVTFLGTLYPFWLLNRHRSRALAWGGFILIRRSLFEQIGGNQAIRRSVLQDFALARAAKRAGARVWVGITNNLLLTRQYRTFREMWEGYSKQAFNMLDGSPAQVLAMAVVVLLMTVVPFAGLVLGASGGPAAYLPVAAFSLALMLVTAIGVLRVMGLPFWWVPAYPVGLLVFTAIAIHSMVSSLLGRTTWRGRRYDVRGAPGSR